MINSSLDVIEVIDRICDQIHYRENNSGLDALLAPEIALDIAIKGDDAISNGGLVAFFEQGNNHAEFIWAMNFIGISGIEEIFNAIELECEGFLNANNQYQTKNINVIYSTNEVLISSLSDNYLSATRNLSKALILYIIKYNALLSLTSTEKEALLKNLR